MKAIVVFLLVMVVIAAAEAKKLEWQGAQALTLIGGEFPIIEQQLSFRSSVSYFWIPSNDTQLFFSYLGPKWTVKKWTAKDSLWLAPQLGVTGNWTEDGSDAVILSLWSGASFFEGQVALFLEGEGYLNSNQQDYYGFYSFEYSPTNYLNVGIHTEQLNELFSFGPHIGISHGGWHSELRYFAGLQKDNYGQTVRIVTALSF